MPMIRALPLAALVVLAAAATASAQFNVRWIAYTNESALRLQAAPAVGLADVDEKDYAWGDVDNDGDIDLVCVRKEPFTTPGRRTNVLFMNEGIAEGHPFDGILVDRTLQYASDSDVPGDMGFLTPTNDRDVVLADFNNDGWLDIATAVTISDGLPKAISHPRIYINKGAINGVWQGFRFEAARSPQLYVLNSNGTPNLANPQPGRFCSIAAGDVTGDGYADLFLGDYDSGGGSLEPPGIDINDRLWVNDGTGHFIDSYQTRMTAAMLISNFSVSAAIADMNNDGRMDVVKDSALQDPRRVDVIYDLGPTTGVFDLIQTAHTNAPYFTSVGDLNNDGRLDLVITDDGADAYRLATGVDALGRVTWGPSTTFHFLASGGSDDGFGSQSVIEDLDRDGWRDVIIADVDVDISGCNRRMHIYHNLGNAPNVTLRWEREMAGTNSGPGWLGAPPFLNADLTGTHNVAVFDIDGDGWNDLVLGRCTGTSVWRCTPPGLETFGVGTPGCNGAHKLTGSRVPRRNTPGFAITCTKAPPNGSGFLFAGFTPYLNGADPLGVGVTLYLDILAPNALIIPVSADAQGNVTFPLPIPDDPLLVGFSVYVQAAFAWPSGPCAPSPYGFSSSNGLRLTFQN
jgi:hypothetical protein